MVGPSFFMRGSFYKYVSILSLDVAAGAVISAIFFARQLSAPVTVAGYAALFFAVLIVYTADHLNDGFLLKAQASTERHRFHQKYQRQLLLVLFAMLIVEFVLIFFVRRPVFVNGGILALTIMAYLAINRKLSFFKEVAVTVLYAFGVLLPAFSLHTTPFTLSVILQILVFILLVMLNTLLFSWLDKEDDERDSRISLATLLDKKHMSTVLRLLIVTVIVLWFFAAAVSHWHQSLSLGLMVSVHALIFFYPHAFGNKTRCRRVGDAAFLLPSISLIVG